MVTDESMGESSAAMKVKVREMDSEIRKLWDNVWKKSKQKFAEQDALLKKHGQSIAASDAFVASTKQQMSKSDDVVAGLSQQIKKTQQLHSQVAENQLMLNQQEKSLELVADKSNRVSADVGKLDRRVKGTEEWVESINGFRRQVNRDLGTLKQNVGQLQGGTP
jgi:chromosome segregation ATPase